MLQNELDDDYAARLAHAYENLVQQPHQQENGYVQISFIEKTDENPDWEETAQNRLLDEIRNAQERGIALHEMAILTRTKAEAP